MDDADIIREAIKFATANETRLLLRQFGVSRGHVGFHKSQSRETQAPENSQRFIMNVLANLHQQVLRFFLCPRAEQRQGIFRVERELANGLLPGTA